MAIGTGIPAEPVKMWANQKVAASLCNTCGRGFELAQEVYACPRCGGHHHLQCWRDGKGCTATPGEVAIHESPPQALELAFRSAMAEDERDCPSCGHAIKTKAVKCRFCGTVLDKDLAQQITPQEIPSYVADEVEKTAKQSLTCSICGLFFLGFILAPIAIIKGYSTLKTLREYPAYADSTSARGKARAGLVIGCIVVAFWVLVLIGALAES